MEERLKRWPHLPLIEGNKIINPKVSGKDQEMLTTQYTESAVSFIEKNKDNPFFVYLPHSMVHVPLYVSDKFKGKSGAGLFGDVMMEVDWSVGEIMKVLRKHDLHENTLFLFTSDNGPWLNYGDHAGSASPLREGKGTMFDGGCREPTLAWWPGTIPASSECNEPAMTIDLLPTIAKLIDAIYPNIELTEKISQHYLQKTQNLHRKRITSITETSFKPCVRGNGNSISLTDIAPWLANPEVPAESPQIILRQKLDYLYLICIRISERARMLRKNFPKITKRLKSLGEKFNKELQKSKRPAGRI